MATFCPARRFALRSTRIATLSILTLVMTLELPVSAGQWPLEPNTVRLTRGDRLLAFGLGPRDEVLRIITNAGIWFHDPKTFELLYLLGVPVDFYRFSDTAGCWPQRWMTLPSPSGMLSTGPR